MYSHRTHAKNNPPRVAKPTTHILIHPFARRAPTNPKNFIHHTLLALRRAAPHQTISTLQVLRETERWMLLDESIKHTHTRIYILLSCRVFLCLPFIRVCGVLSLTLYEDIHFPKLWLRLCSRWQEHHHPPPLLFTHIGMKKITRLLLVFGCGGGGLVKYDAYRMCV